MSLFSASTPFSAGTHLPFGHLPFGTLAMRQLPFGTLAIWDSCHVTHLPLWTFAIMDTCHSGYLPFEDTCHLDTCHLGHFPLWTLAIWTLAICIQLPFKTVSFFKHIILKVKLLSKNSILTKPHHFHEFFN